MARGGAEGDANLLHDAGLALGESDVATRLILDEFDLDLSSFTTRLVVVIIIVVASTHTRAFGAAVLEGAVAGSSQFILGRRMLLVSDTDVGHGEVEPFENRRGSVDKMRVDGDEVKKGQAERRGISLSKREYRKRNDV